MLRRSALAGAFAVCACPCVARSRSILSPGCVLTESEGEQLYPRSAATASASAASGKETIIARSGDPDFDRALAETLLKLSRTLQVSPGFAYYDDHEGFNAYATRLVRLNGADGTVLFGQGFLRQLMRGKESPEVAVAAVCAHEFGHILQFKHNLAARVRGNDPTVKRTELQADFFAGYFAGLRKKERPSYPAAVAALAQYNVGDNHLNSPKHHGTPQERGAAVVRGFEVAYRDNKPLGEAIQISINYASKL